MAIATATKIQRSLSSLDRINEYADSVLSGETVAGPHVRNACRRHFDDLERGSERGLSFDIASADRVFGFFEGVLRLLEGQFEGLPFNLHPAQAFIIGSLFGWKRADGLRRFRRAYVEQGKGNGKALALDTPIPTPTGWTTMGEIKSGDWVFDDAGKPCRVIQAHPVSTDRECYRVEFDDGESVVTSAEHLWMTFDSGARQAIANAGIKNYPDHWAAWKSARGKCANVITTRNIGQTLNVKPGYKNHSIPLAGSLQLSAATLLVDPLVLGVWLGDGSSSSGSARVAADQLNGDQSLIRKEFYRRGYGTSDIADHVQFGVPGLLRRLSDLGVVGDKHVPPQYFRGSIDQRLDLLRGLMLTDGTITKSGQVSFENTNERLIDAVVDLARTLGQSPRKISLNRKTVTGKSVWRVGWSPTIDVFGLGRKSSRTRLSGAQSIRHHDRKIVACDKIESVPVRCITVDSPSSMFLCGKGMVPTHNSPMAGGVGLYGLLGDGESGAQVYAAAAKREQAGILFADAVKMVRGSPSLAKRVEFSGGIGREYNMAHHASGSFFRPVSRDTGKSGSGPRPYFVLADEVHELPDGKILEMLERGFKFRREPLLFMITNSGSDRNSICWSEHEWAVKVAAGNNDAVTDPTYLGEPLDDSMFSYVCALDDNDDPLNDPSCWAKANPLLGTTITEEYLAGVVAQAKNIPAKQNGILRLHFCMWTDAESAWMSREVVEPLLVDFDQTQHKGAQISGGLDLSQSRDITAAAFVVRTGEVEVEAVDKSGKLVRLKKPTFDGWIEAWTPGDTMRARSERDKLPYPIWAQQGHIHAPPGENINYRHVAQTLVEYDRDYKIAMLAYDRYAYRRFEESAAELGLSLPFVEHPQGGTKKGKPTPEMEESARRAGKEAEGLWFPASLRLLEEAMLEKRIRFKRNPVLVSAIMSAVVEKDKWDNAWLAKQKSVNKIDAAVAMTMAFGAANAMQIERKPLIMMVL